MEEGSELNVTSIKSEKCNSPRSNPDPVSETKTDVSLNHSITENELIVNIKMEEGSELIITSIKSENCSSPHSNPDPSSETKTEANSEDYEIPIQFAPTRRHLKKILRKEKWLANLPAKRAKEKMKLKKKRLDARINNTELGPSRKQLKRSIMSKSKCKVRVVIDMSFDDLMNDKDIAKCTKQLLRCYSLNRRAEDPLQLYVTSFSGKTQEEMKKFTGYTNWDVNFQSESVFEIFKSEELVYLTSESNNIITKLDESKVYIIGGLVDHNSHKGLCFELAKTKGIAHAQLPISEFLEMKSRKVLAINHVFEILVSVSAGKSWQEAFISALPMRKGAVAKSEESSENPDPVEMME